MENRLAVMAIIVEDANAVEKVNKHLHDYREYIIGRMGIPYKQRAISMISVAMDAPLDEINALSGKLGKIEGVTAKATISKL
ncbi:putative iron-only hydrogenase system regulator [Acetitomaculum ruminis DSM 5522]|uniref:Putative iron-only hydrogenase system regulator n=1 Tax=Acetitomaculum ruminis DSM 5522 TaxID=1120918 RepID=A0A1I0Z6Z5_9FIRM|nr:TM1266 family iron-only hydrogenase system putative regulator [Acetitomaculum ruminis]SFB21374.1 putative iron-only hydrogenase system regulator [Acetitomaculum ruminis DSM 5522]